MSPRIPFLAGPLAIAVLLHATSSLSAQYEPTKKPAVAAALDWLVEHQAADGGWSFDHRSGKCDQRCGNHGSLANARISATSLAMIAFLGAGQTHKEGYHRRVVRDGLDFLLDKLKVTEDGLGDLTEPGMASSQGLATLVLCEAYGMTDDRDLAKPAQQALRFAQTHEKGMGPPTLRDNPPALGFQLLAVKSGQLSGLEVRRDPFREAAAWLDGLPADAVPDDAAQTAVPVAVLGRTYAIADLTRPELTARARLLAHRGHSKSDIAYNFFATMVVRPHEGEIWKKWNSAARDYLVESQDRGSVHEDGSWYFPDDVAAKAGGRLYCTAMATMCIEVYYRHLLVYQKQAYRPEARAGN